MKYLTKNWAYQSKLVEFIFNLKENDSCDYKTVKQNSIVDFKKSIAWDKQLLKIAKKTDLIDKLYQAKVNKNKDLIKLLPRDLTEKLNSSKILCLGYCNIEDKNLLTQYAQNLLKSVEKASKMARESNELSISRLNLEIDLDEIIGELALKEYSLGNNYYIEISDNVLCVENFIIECRENFVVNAWEENNPLSLWTCLYAIELRCTLNNLFELDFLFVDGDKYDNIKFWEMTISGSNVKIYNKYWN